LPYIAVVYWAQTIPVRSAVGPKCRRERLGSSLVRNSRLKTLSLFSAKTYGVYEDESVGTA